MRTLSLARETLCGTSVFSREGLRALLRREKPWIVLLIAAGIATALGGMLFVLIGTYRSLCAAGIASGHPELLLFYALLGSWLLIFVTAVPLALSTLYYSKDLSLLLSLPIRPAQIVAAKALLLYLYCLPVNIILLVPALWVFFAAYGAPAAAVVSAVIHLVVSPVFPLALVALGVLGLEKVVNLSRFRIALEVVGMTLGIALVLGMQVALSRAAFNALQGGGFPGQGPFADQFASLARALPPVAWAARGFIPSAGPLPLALSLLVSFAALTSVFLLVPLGFVRDALEKREAPRTRGSAPSAARRAVERGGAPRGVTRSLMRREWSILASSSTYIFEAVAEVLILPLLLGIYALILPKDILRQAAGFITSTPAASLIIMAVLVLLTSLTTVSSTSLSREGRLLALSLTIPVRGREQVGAKLLLHLLFFSSAYLMDLCICYVFFRFPLVSLVFLVPGGLALQVGGFALSIFFDLKKPFLEWTHPQQAMKSNMNALAGIGGCAALVAALAGPSALLVLRGVNPFVIGCGAAGVGVALAAVLLPRVLSYADQRYGGGLQMEGAVPRA
jgi:ABC-2 type transport system permease protein